MVAPKAWMETRDVERARERTRPRVVRGQRIEQHEVEGGRVALADLHRTEIRAGEHPPSRAKSARRDGVLFLQR